MVVATIASEWHREPDSLCGNMMLCSFAHRGVSIGVKNVLHRLRFTRDLLQSKDFHVVLPSPVHVGVLGKDRVSFHTGGAPDLCPGAIVESPSEECSALGESLQALTSF